MGRFSRLETGQTGASIEPIVSDEIRPSDGVSAADYATQDAAGCIDHGDRLLFMDERRQALRWYSRAVDLDSTRMDGWTRMILTLLMHGDLGEAAAWIARSLTVYPESPCLLALRAVEYARRGMIRQAMAATDSAIERAGNDPIAYLARGEVLLLAENKNASYCFDQAAKIVSPDDWKTPVIIALILRDSRLWAKAIDYLALGIDRQERQPLIWFQLGLCRAALGQRTQAEKAFQTAAELAASDDPLQQKIRRSGHGTIWRRLCSLIGLK